MRQAAALNMNLQQLTTSMKQKKSGIQSPTISGFGKQNLFEDGPLIADRLLIIPDFYTPARAYMPIINSLCKYFRVAIFDLPGHFGAAPLANHKEQTVVLLFEQLLDFLGWHEFGIYSHGGGCMIAAILQKELGVKKVVYCCPKTHLSREIETVKSRHKGCKFVFYHDFTALKAQFKDAVADELVFESIFNYFENEKMMTLMDTDVKNIMQNNEFCYEHAAKLDSLFLVSESDPTASCSAVRTYLNGIGAQMEILPIPRFEFHEESIEILSQRIQAFFDVKSITLDTELPRIESSVTEEMMQLKLVAEMQ